jgi:hypothetical protein
MASGLRIEYPEPLRDVYLCFEAHCVGACCGYGAYDINAHRLLGWIDGAGSGQLLIALDQLDEVIEAVGRHPGSEVTDGELWWNDKLACVEFLDALRIEMLRALVHSRPGEVFEQRWLGANGRTAELVARWIVEQSAYGSTPVLADALEDAGCDNPELLRRCRSTRADARTNWVVSLLLAGSDGEFELPIEPTATPPARYG